jgi:Uma2 family endonuclease
MQNSVLKYITPEEYLAREEVAEIKSEYYRGEVCSMAGASISHNRLVKNLITGLETGLRGENREAFMDNMRLWVEAFGLFTYPDLMVVCGAPKFYENRDDTIINPLVIIEVLSESTKNYDRGEKLKFYRGIPSLQEYVLIDQYSIHLEQYFLEAPPKWVLSEYHKLVDTLKFKKIDFQISLKDLYQRVVIKDSAAGLRHGASGKAHGA